MASELKMASAFFFDSRSPISSSDARRATESTRRMAAAARPAAVVGAVAAGLAVRTPCPV